MRDQFVADVNDFGKYGLLRRLCGVIRDGDDDEHDPDLKLGVVWYYLTGKTKGGGNTDYPKLAHCDPALYTELQKLLTSQANRTVANVEKLDFLRVDSRYYREITPIWGTPNSASQRIKDQRTAKADQWLDGATERVRDADIVFLDPDNKIAEGESRIGKDGPKFAHIDEIKAFWEQGHSLVIYHQTATSPIGRDLVSIAVKSIQREIPDAAIDALHFKRANRLLVFFVLSQECQRDKIRKRIDAMLKGAWGEHFKCLYREPAADGISQAAN